MNAENGGQQQPLVEKCGRIKNPKERNGTKKPGLHCKSNPIRRLRKKRIYLNMAKEEKRRINGILSRKKRLEGGIKRMELGTVS